MQKAGVEDINKVIKRSKIKYAGQMVRQEQNNWSKRAKRATEWAQYDYRRRKERPETR